MKGPPAERSSTEPHTAFEILESRIGAERIETRPQEDAGVESLVIALFEPRHGLIVVTERRVDDGNLRGIRRAALRAFLQIFEKLDGFISPA
jgi:hypothetical protein